MHSKKSSASSSVKRRTLGSTSLDFGRVYTIKGMSEDANGSTQPQRRPGAPPSSPLADQTNCAPSSLPSREQGASSRFPSFSRNFTLPTLISHMQALRKRLDELQSEVHKWQGHAVSFRDQRDELRATLVALTQQRLIMEQSLTAGRPPQEVGRSDAFTRMRSDSERASEPRTRASIIRDEPLTSPPASPSTSSHISSPPSSASLSSSGSPPVSPSVLGFESMGIEDTLSASDTAKFRRSATFPPPTSSTSEDEYGPKRSPSSPPTLIQDSQPRSGQHSPHPLSGRPDKRPCTNDADVVMRNIPCEAVEDAGAQESTVFESSIRYIPGPGISLSRDPNEQPKPKTPAPWFKARV